MSVSDTVLPQGKPTFADRLVTSFDQRWEKYCRELRRCQKTCSEKAVHDLRVATRRLISSIDIMLIAVEDNSLGKIRQALRKRFKESGALRDVQVQLVRLEKVRDDYPELEQFYTLLLLREKRMLRNLEREVRKVRVAALDQQVRESRIRILRSLGEQSAVAKTAATGIAAASFLRTVALSGKVNPEDPDTIHSLRISFKKLRYIVEGLQHVLPGISPSLLKSMNQYQDRMGLIQDLEVFSESFRRYLTKVRKGSRINFLPFQQQLARERQVLVTDFLEHAGELLGFWTMKDPSGHRKTSSGNIQQRAI